MHMYINPLFKDCNILKFYDKVAFENPIKLYKSFEQEFPNHSIADLDFPQIFIRTTQGGPIWAVLM